MDNSALELDRQLCFRAYTASRLTIRLYKPMLDRLKLTYPQYVAMMVLWEDKEIGFRDLGKRLHMQTGTLTPIIQRLEKLEYVRKLKDPNDDRRAIVTLTETGEALIPEAREIPQNLAKALGLSSEEYKQYAKTLDELIQKLFDADMSAIEKK